MRIVMGHWRGIVAGSAAVAVAVAASMAVGWRPWRHDTRHVAPSGFAASAQATVTDSDTGDATQDAAIRAVARSIAMPASFSPAVAFFAHTCGPYPWMSCWRTAAGVKDTAGEIERAMVAAGMREPTTRCESVCSVDATVDAGTVYFVVAPQAGPDSPGSAIYEAMMTPVSAEERESAIVMWRQRADVEVVGNAIAMPGDFTRIDKLGSGPCGPAMFGCWATPLNPEVAAHQLARALAAYSATTNCHGEDWCEVTMSENEGNLEFHLEAAPSAPSEGLGQGSPGCEISAVAIPKLQEQLYGGMPSVTPSV